MLSKDGVSDYGADREVVSLACFVRVDALARPVS